MKSSLAALTAAAALVSPIIAAVPAEAQYYSSSSYYDEYQPRPSARDYRGYGHTYYGHHHAYYQDCRRSSGTTGLIAGGAGGAILGKALGGDTLGTVLGAIGGGLLGRHLDKKHDAAQNYENGC